MKIPEVHKKYLRKDFSIPRYIELRLKEEEIQNIEIYGYWLSALEQGKIEPVTETQKRFLEVLAGRAKPWGKIQRAWLKYKKLKTTPIECNFCAGKGYGSDPATGGRVTCHSCHGAGKMGLTHTKITVEGTY